MKELITFRKYLNEGVIKEEKSIKDEIKRASKIILTNLISKNPDGWEDDHEEYVGVTNRDEFDDIGHNGRVVVSLMIDWAKYHYNKGIYKEVDELLNNYDWDSKFKRHKINEENKTEGVINEEIEKEDIKDAAMTILSNTLTSNPNLDDFDALEDEYDYQKDENDEWEDIDSESEWDIVKQLVYWAINKHGSKVLYISLVDDLNYDIIDDWDLEVDSLDNFKDAIEWDDIFKGFNKK